MSQIVCAQCGKQAQVPFEPAPGRPVYCPDCHRQLKRSGGLAERPSRAGERVEDERPDEEPLDAPVEEGAEDEFVEEHDEGEQGDQGDQDEYSSGADDRYGSEEE